MGIVESFWAEEGVRTDEWAAARLAKVTAKRAGIPAARRDAWQAREVRTKAEAAAQAAALRLQAAEDRFVAEQARAFVHEAEQRLAELVQAMLPPTTRLQIAARKQGGRRERS